jgi:enoyl-CoA hydratase
MTQPQTFTHTSIDAEGVATLTFQGAKAMNIIGSAAILALTEALARLRDEPGVRVLVLRGQGDKAFIGGADIGEMAALTPATAEVFITRLRDLCEAVYVFPVPVIARIAGWCLGGGLEVAMACDLRFGSTDSQYGMPEVRVGIPSVIHAALLPRLVGPATASWMLLTGETMAAAAALAHGLVHRVVDLGELDAAVQATASQMAGLGPHVLRQQKALLRDWERVPLALAIDRSVAEFGSAYATGEPQRYMNQFLARKR